MLQHAAAIARGRHSALHADGAVAGDRIRLNLAVDLPVGERGFADVIVVFGVVVRRRVGRRTDDECGEQGEGFYCNCFMTTSFFR